MRPLRSLLFTPGNRGEMVEKALAGAADAVIVDLEDAVPSAAKDDARSALLSLSPGAKPVYARVNGVSTEWVWDDLDAAVEAGLDGILIPKVEDVSELERVDDALRTNGWSPGEGLELVVMIESALGVINTFDLARGDGVASICCGSAHTGDLATDLGISGGAAGPRLEYARAHVLLAARAAGIGHPLDGVYVDVRNEAGFRTDCERARQLGYTGRTVIHPAQIPIAHDVFTPTETELELQRRIVAAFDDAVQQGRASVLVDGEMVDQAMARRAEQMLELASRVPGAGA